jgi:hypothetical protein
MAQRSSPRPTSVPVGIVPMCVLTLVTGWLVLRGAPFTAAIPAMAVVVVMTIGVLLRRPRRERSAARRSSRPQTP